MVIAGKKIGLTTQIFIAMILGSIFGLAFSQLAMDLEFIGTIWLNCIKMIVVPMVLFTIITGIVSQNDIKSLGRITFRIIVYYILTTIIASIIGLAVSHVFQPGAFANFTGLESKEVAKATADFSVAKFFTDMFSSNMFKTFQSGNIIQTLIIAIMLAIAILRITNEETKATLIKGFNAVNAMVFSLIKMIMEASPIGVFFLMGSSFGEYGIDIFTGMASLLGTYYVACLVQAIVIYGGLLWFSVGISPYRFLKDTAELWIYTITTCSSVAAIPITIKVAKEKFNVPDSISAYTTSLGTQLNSDGSVILYACVLSFIGQVTGTSFDLGTMMQIILLSAIISNGGGGIPGSGIVKLFIMVEAFGLPTEIVGIIAAFYHVFDLGTTTNNCLGDLAGTIFVSKLEEKTKTAA